MNAWKPLTNEELTEIERKATADFVPMKDSIEIVRVVPGLVEEIRGLRAMLAKTEGIG